MGRPQKAQRFVRKNVTLPPEFEQRLERLRTRLGTASDSELIRQAIVRLDDDLRLNAPDAAQKEKADA